MKELKKEEASIAEAMLSTDEIVIDQEIWKSYLYLETLDRHTLASLTPPLTTAQYHALVALAQVPEQSLIELATRLLCGKANASGLVERLTILGLVDRQRDSLDARRVVLRLTQQGHEALEHARQARASALLHVLAPAGKIGLQSMADALHRLTSLLENAVSEL